MSKKKSYMDKNNILNESFFNALKNVLAIVGAKGIWDSAKETSARKKDSKNIKKIQKIDKKLEKIRSKIKKLEREQETGAKQLAKELEKKTGVKVSDKAFKKSYKDVFGVDYNG